INHILLIWKTKTKGDLPMKNSFKKAITLVLTLILLTALFVPSFAEKTVTSNDVIYQEKEIKDTKEIMKRAYEGINDDENFKVKKEDVKLEKIKLGKDEKDIEILDIKSTSQKLKSYKAASGDIIEEYVGHAIITVGSREEAEKKAEAKALIKSLKSLGVATLFASTADSRERWDESFGVKIRSTMYYNRVVGTELHDVLSAETEVIDRDTTIRVTKLFARVASGTKAYTSTGSYIGNYSPIYDKEITAPSGGSYAVGQKVTVTDPNNYYFNTSASVHYIGSYSEAKLERGTSSVWYVYTTCTLGGFPGWSPGNR
ncbi:hypothetical protein, partial [Anaerosolibacter sp.]|uniref:hypothetical protein n=1 Tax=Anaerosolibacter sp. TaxID=1872527 RepID=UPI0039EEB51B